MKKIFYLVAAAVLLFSSCCSDRASKAITEDKDIENRIEKVLRGMTLEEKIGQMMQITADFIYDPATGGLNEYGLAVMREAKVGSILNTLQGHADSASAYRAFIDKLQDEALAATGIPVLYGLDQIHGASYTLGSVLFPQEIGIAASFNEQFAFDMGEINAYETRACNVPWVFTPTLDLSRNPCWPRMWESFGEDPYVHTKMGVQETLGLQGADPNHIDGNHVAACIKHYLAYGAASSGMDRTPSSVSYREMKEKFLPPFKAAMEAGALSIMVNSAINDGIPFHANKLLLTGWAKEEIGWDGMIVTDWADIRNIYSRDYVAGSYKEALAMAINAGVDMIMEPYSLEPIGLIKELVQEKKIPMSRIDDAARRVLRIKFRLGLFDDPYGKRGSFEKFGSEEFVQKAYRAAVESEVLLKNDDNILPLKKSTRILVVGPNADNMRPLGGGWNYSWQGDAASKPEYTGQFNTIYEALKAKFDHVEYVSAIEYPGWDYQAEIVSDFGPAVRAARRADVIVACIGENSYCETPGNLIDLNMSLNQKNMIRALHSAGKPIVMVLNEGRPRVINDIEPLAKAVVHVLLPGNYGGDALAALLIGEENFSAKMPYTYPKYVNKLNTYDYKLAENRATMEGLYNYDATIEVQWPFAHGLSYTTFAYSNMTVDKTEFKAGDVLTVSVDVENTGKVAGKEAVLLFSSDKVASVAPDVRRLREFTKISLEPGEKQTVRFELKADDLAFVNHDLEWTLEPGEFRLAIGSESVTVNCISGK